MGIEVRAATRFDDVASILGPRNPDATVCWCLSHRLDSRTNRSLAGLARGEYVRDLCAREVAPGVCLCDEKIGQAAPGGDAVGILTAPDSIGLWVVAHPQAGDVHIGVQRPLHRIDRRVALDVADGVGALNFHIERL